MRKGVANTLPRLVSAKQEINHAHHSIFNLPFTQIYYSL
jgi:hypothetical protein